MFFFKRVIFVTTSLSIIPMSLIQQNPGHKTIIALFTHTAIKCCFGRKAYKKCFIIVYLSSCSVLVEEWRRVLLDSLFDIAPLL